MNMNDTWTNLQDRLSYCNRYKMYGFQSCIACKNTDCAHNTRREQIMEKDKRIEALWNEFGDIPMNPETEEIETKWNNFPAGTNREEIWYWFDEQHSKGVGWLMNDYDGR